MNGAPTAEAVTAYLAVVGERLRKLQDLG